MNAVFSLDEQARIASAAQAMAQKREESLVKMGIASRSLVTDKDGEAVCRALRSVCRIARLGPSEAQVSRLP